ncbi:hypothetical protein EON81_01775 [bacterium]|nr:MAG: hypothetical protein EON81_01775 [bacterium]
MRARITDYTKRLNDYEMRGKRLVATGYVLKGWTAVAALAITTGLLPSANQGLGITILLVTSLDTAFTFLSRVVVAKEAAIQASRALSIRDKYHEGMPSLLREVRESGGQRVEQAEVALAAELRTLCEQIKAAVDKSDLEAIRKIQFDSVPSGIPTQ